MLYNTKNSYGVCNEFMLKKQRGRIETILIGIFLFGMICVVSFSNNNKVAFAVDYVPTEELAQQTMETEEPGEDSAEIILKSLSSVVTVGFGIAEAIVALILWRKKKDINIKEIAFFGISFFCLVFFNSFALSRPLSAAWIVLIDSLFYIVGTLVLLLNFLGKPVKKLVKKSRILGKITNRRIIAEQVFSVTREVGFGNVAYTLTSIDHTSKSEYDINGILSVTYRISYLEDTTFQTILEGYLSLVNDGKEETGDRLKELLIKQKNRLTDELKQIPSPEAVTPADCCKARILMIYLAFLQILEPSPKSSDMEWYGGEAYIGELNIGEGKFGVDIEIEKRLFTLLRTGLFGAVLLGHRVRYLFSYRRSGYKTGRRYSAICLPTSDDTTSDKVCLITLDNIRSKTIPQYITDAIRNEERRIMKTVEKAEAGES